MELPVQRGTQTGMKVTELYSMTVSSLEMHREVSEHTGKAHSYPASETTETIPGASED